MGRILLSCSVAAVYLLAAASCATAPLKSSDTLPKMPPKSAFEKIEYGSSYEQVEKELGQTGLLISEYQNETGTRKIYRWSDGRTPCRIYLSFRNGKLAFKKYSGNCN